MSVDTGSFLIEVDSIFGGGGEIKPWFRVMRTMLAARKKTPYLYEKISGNFADLPISPVVGK